MNLETFKQKWGPLPIWAWAGLILLAILAYMWWTHSGFFGAAPTTGSGSGANQDTNNNPQGIGSTLGGGVNDATSVDPTGNPSPRGGSYVAQSTSGDPLSLLHNIAPTGQAPVIYTAAPTPGSRYSQTGDRYVPTTSPSGTSILSSFLNRVIPSRSSGPAPAQYTGGSAFGRNPG